MWYIIIIGFLIFGFVFGPKIIAFSKQPSPASDNKRSLIGNDFNPSDTIKAMFSKKQIDEKLKHLAETSAPDSLSFGAMCYETVAINQSIHEYLCTICGEKTIYKKSKDKEKFQYIDQKLWAIDACRREIEKVHGINIKLYEKEFCSHCSPKTEHPKLYLLVNIAGQQDTTKISDFSYSDIRILHEFLDNKLVHKTDNDGETPLADNIGRIKELLGIK